MTPCQCRLMAIGGHFAADLNNRVNLNMGLSTIAEFAAVGVAAAVFLLAAYWAADTFQAPPLPRGITVFWFCVVSMMLFVFLYGVIFYLDAPIRPCGESFC